MRCVKAIHHTDEEYSPELDRFQQLLKKLTLSTGKAIFDVVQLDQAGLHDVRVERHSGQYRDELYLDDYEACDAFAVAAVGKLCRPGEDPNEMRQSFNKFLRDERNNYYDTRDHLVLERMSQMVYDSVEWLWPGRINADKLTMLIGEPGVGKSLAAMDIAARVTTGAPWPDEPANTPPREPGSVLLLAEVDDSADVIHPRLRAVGADLGRVHLLRTYMKAGEENTSALPFSVAGNLDMLADCIEKIGDCKLIIIDPLSHYIEGTHNRSDITRLLGNLIELAVSKRLAVLVVSHFSQGGPSVFRYGAAANARFVAAARSVWLIERDQHNHDRRRLLPMKNNLSRDWLGLPFCIRACDTPQTARIEWGTQPLVIDARRDARSREPHGYINSYATRRQAVCNWLRNQLAESEKFVQDVMAAATLARIGERSLRRALREVGVISRKGSTGLWIWSLPETKSDHSSERCPTLLEVGSLQLGRKVEQVEQVEQPGLGQPQPEPSARHNPG